MTRRELLARCSTLSLAACAPTFAAKRQPNVILFMTDDHGAWALGSYGCREMHTPNIDALAAGGTRFTRAFAATPVCSPSRLTYLTGKLPSQHGVHDWLVPKDSFGEASPRWLAGHQTYSEILANSGYTMGMVGKWHMGQDDKAQAGFSYWATIPGGGGPYRDVEILKNGTPIRAPFKTDALGDCALEFIEQNQAKPFYLMMPFYAPHTPFDFQPDVYRAPYQQSAFSCFPRTPMSPEQNRGLRNHHGNTESMRAYSALISGVDANVGRIVRRLEQLRLREDTLVIFTADQGWNAGHHGVWGKGNGTVPLNMLDESIRVPMIWNHPGRIRAGRAVDAMISSYDFFPTILDYAGVTATPDRARPGRSYVDFVRGKKPKWRDRLYFEYEYVRGVRTETWKLIERASPWPSELYNLDADPGETRNLIADGNYAAKRNELSADLRRFFSERGSPPIENWRGANKQTLTEYQAVGSGNTAK